MNGSDEVGMQVLHLSNCCTLYTEVAFLHPMKWGNSGVCAIGFPPSPGEIYNHGWGP